MTDKRAKGKKWTVFFFWTIFWTSFWTIIWRNLQGGKHTIGTQGEVG